MDRFDAMQAFARVAETGSFTKAAETLRTNKTSVTQIIQQLEARLRVKLLHRTTRKVQVTADGAAYYERVVRLLAELDDTEASLSGAAASPRGRLRVDVPSPLACFVLMPALPDFHARYPEIQIDLGASDRMVDLIRDNVDCVIRGGEITDPSLIARRVGELPISAYAAPAYLRQHGTPTHPKDLEGPAHRIVGFMNTRTGRVQAYAMQRQPGKKNPKAAAKEAERITVQGRYMLSVDDGVAYLAAGVAGLGVLWLPRYLAAEHQQRGELVPLFEDWQFPSMPLTLAYPPNRYVGARLRVFIDWMVALMARQAPVGGDMP